MGVPFKLILYARDEPLANLAARAAFKRISELNRILSDYDPDSELSRLSRSAGANTWVIVSDDLWRVLWKSQELAQRTQGAFDITVGPYVRLWRRAKREKQLPSAALLADARACVGFQAIELDPKTQRARLHKPEMRLDAGGIAMGYAVDEAIKVLKAHRIESALVDASGDIGVMNAPPGEAGWRIAVSPLARDSAHGEYLTLASAAVTTSGDAFQHVTIAGKRYSHIIDPQTGLGLTTQMGVTVLACDCVTADSYATAVSVLGPKAGLELIESTPATAALIVVAQPDEATKEFRSRRWPCDGKNMQSRLKCRLQSTP